MATPEEAPLIDGFKKYNRTISTDICPCCGEVLESDASAMVECENCLRWFHFTCVNYTNNYGPNDKYFCDTCIFLNTKRMLSDLQTIPPFSSKRYPDVQTSIWCKSESSLSRRKSQRKPTRKLLDPHPE